MLVRDDLFVVVGVDGLMLRRHVDIFWGELEGGAREVFQQIGVMGGVKVEVGEGGVAGLGWGGGNKSADGRGGRGAGGRGEGGGG